MRGRESAADQWAAWWAVCFSFFLWLLLDLQGECCRLSGCMVVKPKVCCQRYCQSVSPGLCQHETSFTGGKGTAVRISPP